MEAIEFTPAFGNRPSRLVGRESDLRTILSGLDERPGSKGRAIVMLGQRGFGKTVMLWELADRAIANGFVVATPTSVREGLLERIVEKLQEDGSRVLGRTQARPSEVGVALFGISASLQFTHDEATKSAEYRLTSLCRRLTRNGLGTLILVDELQPNQPEVRRLVGTYQELVGEGLDIALVLAGLPSCVSDMLNDSVLTFLNRARKLTLGPLAPGEVEAFYRKAFQSEGIRLSAELIRDSARKTCGSPYLMQLIGHYLVSYASDEGTLDEERYGCALTSAQDDFENDVCKTTLAALSDKDMAYLQAMAELGTPAQTAEVARGMGVTPDYAQQYRRRLLDAGVIEAPRRGQVTFSIPFLADYLRHLQDL